MLTDAILAWFHFIFAFVMVGVLIAEAFILRLPVDSRVAKLLARVDLLYGGSAGLLVLAGGSRLIWGAKDWAYYQAEPFFWAKMATFAIVGLISILPTMSFLRWARMASANNVFVAAEADVKRIRGYVMGELVLIAVLLLFAVLMARAISY